MVSGLGGPRILYLAKALDPVAPALMLHTDSHRRSGFFTIEEGSRSVALHAHRYSQKRAAAGSARAGREEVQRS